MSAVAVPTSVRGNANPTARLANRRVFILAVPPSWHLPDRIASAGARCVGATSVTRAGNDTDRSGALSHGPFTDPAPTRVKDGAKRYAGQPSHPHIGTHSFWPVVFETLAGTL